MQKDPEQGQLSRRSFLALAALTWVYPPRSDDVEIVQFSDAGVRLGKVRLAKVVKSDQEWRSQLSPLSFEITRQGGTERPFSGEYWNLHEDGLFRCICCDTALFSSRHKFDSGTGWPSFWEVIAKENVIR